MVYRRVVMVRLILMFMLRYFWVSIGFKFQTPLRAGFRRPKGLVSRVYGGPVGSEVFEPFWQCLTNEEATYFGCEIC